MIIDKYYDNIDKNNFYLGIVSQVYKNSCVVQIENLSWLNMRRIKEELLRPNTINFNVVIESSLGIFLGEVFQTKFSNTKSVHEALLKNESENVFPEVGVNIIAFLDNSSKKFKPVGFRNVGLTDKVYISNIKLNSLYFESLEIDKYNKNRPKLENLGVLENTNGEILNLFPETLFDRHIISVGATNSGKSTTSLKIIDELIKKDKKILFLDSTGEYSASFLKEDSFKKLVLGENTYIETSKISILQFSTLFECNDSSQPAALAEAIKSLRLQYKQGVDEVYIKENKLELKVKSDFSKLDKSDLEFNISLLPEQIEREGVKLEKAPENQLKYVIDSFNLNNRLWLKKKVDLKLTHTKLKDFFNKKEFQLLNEIDKFMKNETKSLYINISEIGTDSGTGSMIIDLISEYISNNQPDKAFVFFIDEVHRYTRSIDGSYKTGLTFIAREGRKKGIYLFLTTQNPKDVSEELLGQIGTLIIHRLTNKKEIERISNFIDETSLALLPKLHQGQAILVSINLLKDLFVKFQKSNRKHKNNTPLL